jgi:hypothetical protein
MDLIEIGWEDMNWIHLLQNRDQWHLPVKNGNEVPNSVPMSWFSWLPEKLLAFQEALCSMQLIWLLEIPKTGYMALKQLRAIRYCTQPRIETS